MKIIHKNIALFDEVIGRQQAQTEEMRPMNFVTSCEVADGRLLYNVLTRELILLEEGEHEDDKSIYEYLKQQWFLVPQSFNEIEFERQVKGVERMFAATKKPIISSFTVFTTMGCNARCYYCFEKGRIQEPMSHETAVKAANYMIAQACGKKISIHWFGGEPLYNKDAIVTICDIFRKQNIEFKSNVVSNGYLFDEEMVKHAVDDWNLTFVQITLDGTQNIYNRSKAYIYKDDPNPFETVLGNIQYLLDYNVRVSIRLNVSNRNGDDLLMLIDLLHDRFGENKNLTIYSHSLFEFSSVVNLRQTEESRHNLYLKRKEIEERIAHYHLNRKKGRVISNRLKLNHCMSDNNVSLTILPDGHLGKCEHYSDDHFVGHIDNEELDSLALQEHKEVLPDLEECKTCAYHPDCIRLKVCKENYVCFPEIREERIGNLHKAMKYAYEEYLNKRDTEELEDDGTELQC